MRKTTLLLIPFLLSACSSKDLEVAKVIKAEFPNDSNAMAELLVKQTKDGHVTQVTCIFPFGVDSTSVWSAKKVSVKAEGGKNLCTVLEIDWKKYRTSCDIDSQIFESEAKAIKEGRLEPYTDSDKAWRAERTKTCQDNLKKSERMQHE